MIIAFTGAGISKESGIQTFNDRPDIRSKLVRSYANAHPEEYRKVMREFVGSIRDKSPNDAHIALAEYDIPIITMNVDGLHEKAGSKKIIPIHGTLPTDEELEYCDKLYNKPVLYEDPAPEYSTAFDFLDRLKEGDIFLVIGASEYTQIAFMLRQFARSCGAVVAEIQDNASVKVREFLEIRKNKIESLEDYLKREVIY